MKVRIKAKEVGFALNDNNMFLLIRAGLIVESLLAVPDALSKWVGWSGLRG